MCSAVLPPVFTPDEPAGPSMNSSPTLPPNIVRMDTSNVPVPGNEEQRGSLREQVDHLASCA